MVKLNFPPEDLKTEGLARIRYLIRTNANRQELTEAINYEMQNVEKNLEFSRKAPKYPKPKVLARRKKSIEKFEAIKNYLKYLLEML